MTEKEGREREEGKQNALVHEGAPPENYDGNEGADEIANVEQPSGQPIEEVRED